MRLYFQLLNTFFQLNGRLNLKSLSRGVITMVFAVFLMTAGIAVMNGFEYALNSALIDKIPHLRVTSPEIDRDRFTLESSDIALYTNEITEVIPYQASMGLIRDSGKEIITQLIAFEDGMYPSILELSPIENESIIISDTLSTDLGLGTNNELVLFGLVADLNAIANIPRVKVLGIREVMSYAMAASEERVALISSDTLNALASQRYIEKGLLLYLETPLSMDSTIARLNEILSPLATITRWDVEYRNLFESINITRAVLWVILFMLFVISLFNLFSMNLLEVKSRQSFIALLKVLGLQSHLITKVFLLVSLVRISMAIIIGLFLGLLFMKNLDLIIQGMGFLIGENLLSSDVYGIDALTGIIYKSDIYLILSVTFLSGLFGSFLTARQTVNVFPAEALRNE
ncbi:MAG: FtsX-like permease family protein [Gammaproteobacteria bacterium]